jgi:hypothetical protein
MESIKRAPNYLLVKNFEASRALSAVQKGDCLNCNGYEYAHIQVIPDGGAATVAVGYWCEEAEAAIVVNPAESYSSVNPFEITVAVRGRMLALAVTVTGSAKVLASAFNWNNPD